ncbi:hypothetical protein HOLleu_01752 [Holothuria leucospilota]|uniref:Uncharacterized protein n=1 Tax=Holothuria leucospilota TaxID=206669 RepID=A0A9Q1CPR8_HOLLE|nr:hypothetical protein HOLleu_01752 [Holothuria leucospilota]
MCGLREDLMGYGLLRVDKQTLEAAINTCRANETATSQLTELSHDQGRTSDVHEDKSKSNAKKAYGKSGRRHTYAEGPAVGKTCRRCGGANLCEYVYRTKLAPDGGSPRSDRNSKGWVRNQVAVVQIKVNSDSTKVQVEGQMRQK